MTGPLILIFFVAGGDADDPTVRAMTRATRDAVTPGIHVVVRDMRDAPTDSGVVSLEQTEHAGAVVELSWKDETRREALLRVHVAAGPWVERSVLFAAEDADAERGRTLGFAIAAVLPEREEAQESSPPPPPSPNDSSAAVRHAPTADRRVRFELDALAAVGIAGLSGGFGGEAAAEWRALGSLGLRAGAGVIGGGASGAFLSTTTVRLTGGLAWDPLPASGSRRWDLSIAADCVLERLSVTYSAPGSASSTRARWLPGAGIALDLRWRFASIVEGLAGVGADDVFSPTYVLVRGASTVTFPAVRGLGRLGLAIGF